MTIHGLVISCFLLLIFLGGAFGQFTPDGTFVVPIGSFPPCYACGCPTCFPAAPEQMAQLPEPIASILGNVTCGDVDWTGRAGGIAPSWCQLSDNNTLREHCQCENFPDRPIEATLFPTAAPKAFRCDADGEILQIEWSAKDSISSFVVLVRKEENESSETVFIDSWSRLPVKNFCISMLDCHTLYLGWNKNDGQMQVSLNGQALSLNSTKIRTSYSPDLHEQNSIIEIGACPSASCSDPNEGLFEYFGHSTMEKRFHGFTWKLEDAFTGKELARSCSDVDCNFYGRYERHHRCFQRDGCYRLVMENWSRIYSRDETVGPAGGIVSLDGSPIDLQRDNRFNTVVFGDGCERCNSTTESLLEMYLAPHSASVFGDEEYPEILWRLTKELDVLQNGTVRGKTTDQLLYYSQCVPLDACLALNWSIPEAANRDWDHRDFYNYIRFQVRLDGILYADSNQIGLDLESDQFHRSVVLGNCTSAGQICNDPLAGYFDAQLIFDSRYKKSYAALYYGIEEDTFDSFLPGYSYRYLSCLDTARLKFCRPFRFRESKGAEFSLSVNGTLALNKNTCVNNQCKPSFSRTGTGYETVYETHVCAIEESPRLSKGEITGVVVGAGLVVIAIVVWYYCPLCKAGPTGSENSANIDTGTVVESQEFDEDDKIEEPDLKVRVEV